eukprot:PhM_4_TR76/c0_g1_i1/m.42110/K04802/PCNA; proliferating cell nuclear antigen
MELHTQEKSIITIFRCLKCLQELSNTAYLEVKPSGMFFQAVDNSNVSMAQLIIRPAGLLHFETAEVIHVGVPLKSLTTVLACMNSTDNLQMTMVSPYDELHLRNTSNTDTKRHGRWTLKLSDMDDGHMAIPPADCMSDIVMDSSLLREVVMTYFNSTATLIITVDHEKQLIEFSVGVLKNDDVSAGKTTLVCGKPDCPRSPVIRKRGDASNPNIVVVALSTQFLQIISKANTVADKVRLQLHADQPSRIMFDIGIGTLQFILAPHQMDE